MNVLFLVNSKCTEDMLEKEYFSFFGSNSDIHCFFQYIWYPPQKSLKAKPRVNITEAREWLKENIEENYDYIVCCDANYMKACYKNTCKPEKEIGYKHTYLDTEIPLFYCPSALTVFYNPDRTRAQIRLALQALVDDINGSYKEPGKGILKNVQYPKTPDDIAEVLVSIIDSKFLTCDIETYSLRHIDSSLASIAFAGSDNSGIAFSIDADANTKNQEVRALLKEFLELYKGKLVFHNICFDAYILIYQLFMDSPTDYEGMLKGINLLLEPDKFEDTKLIAYLATNNASGNHLSLKELAYEYAGNWGLGEDIKDFTNISNEELLSYNLTDSCCTYWVYEKYYQKMCNDNQLDIYENIFKPACKDIIEMQLVGMPIDLNKVYQTEQELKDNENQYLKNIADNSYVQEFVDEEKQRLLEEKNSKLKKKQLELKDISFSFNAGSADHLNKLLYQKLNLPVLERTNTGNPAVGQDTLEKLKNKTTDPVILDLLENIIRWQQSVKITGTFIKAFKEAPQVADNDWRLFGKFNLGGTVSGRLSSSGPNLQNLPATGSPYAKPIKRCFRAPEGWLMCGMDFASLEDRIAALTTKDPQKLAVYTDGYDGHCLRAYAYFHEQMPDIQEQMEEIDKPGQTYRIEMDDGTVKFLNQDNPLLKELQNA